MRVLALGSCRIHDPLMVSHRLGQVEYLNRRFKSREPIYLQDIHEMIQFFRLAMGEIPMPAEIGPFAFYKGLRFDKRMPRVLRDAERVVIEVCTDKHYHAMGYAMPSARTRPIGSLSKRRARLSSTDIAEGMSTLQALLDRPVLVMPHVAVRLTDGGMLVERIAHIEKTAEAARQAGLPVLDPRSFVERDGQQRALDKGGTDIHHYAKDYLPIAGREIAKALHTCTEIDRTASVLDRE